MWIRDDVSVLTQGPLTAERAKRLLAVIFASTILIGLSATMISIALPRAVSDLGASAEQSTWMLLSYLLINGSTLVLAGQLADAWSPGAVFRIGLVLFASTAVGLAIVSDALSFIAFRSVQGFAGALLLSTGGAMIAVAYPKEKMHSAIGVYFAGFAIAQVAGPSIGGLVTVTLGWRWLFVITALIALASLAGGWRLLASLPTHPRPKGRMIDPWGNLIILLGLGGLLYALSHGQPDGWLSVGVVGGLAITVLAMPLFFYVERRVPNPAVRIELLTDRTFLLANFAGFLQIIPRMTIAVMLSLYYQSLRGAGPLEAAFAVTPLAIGMTVGSLTAGRFSARWGPSKAAMRMNLGTAVGILIIIACIATNAGPGWLGLGLFITGFTTGVFSTLNSSTILSSVPPDRAGSTNGVRTMIQSAGVSIGTALMLAIILNGVSVDQAQAFYAANSSVLTDASRAVLTSGYLRAFAVMLGLVLVAFYACVALVRREKSDYVR